MLVSKIIAKTCKELNAKQISSSCMKVKGRVVRIYGNDSGYDVAGTVNGKFIVKRDVFASDLSDTIRIFFCGGINGII